MGFVVQYRSHWLSQSSVNTKSAGMQMYVLFITSLLMLKLSFAQAASLHQHSGLHCNHVHPKPDDVSNI